MLTRYKLILSFAVALITASANADSQVYVITGSDEFGTVNLATGAFNQIGAITPSGGGAAGLVAGPSGSLLTLDFSGNLDAINPATGATTIIGATGLGGNANILAEVGGVVYATDFNNNLYRVNTTTGAATLIGATGIPALLAPPFTTNPDGSVNLLDESLYGVGGKLYATFDEFSLGTDGYTINPSPSDPSISPELYQIDPTTGVATLIAPTGDHILSTVEVGGTLYAFEGTISATTPLFPGPPLIQLMTLDLTNGNTSLVADLNPDVPIYGASPVPPVPEPDSLALVGTGLVALASRLRRRQL